MTLRTFCPAFLTLVFLLGCKSPPQETSVREVPVVAPAEEAAAVNSEPSDREGPAEGAKRPNVLLVIFDDLNDWVEPLGGHPAAKTRHLNKIAGRGLLFTNAHTDAPACNPARTALLSGLRPSTSGVYSNGQPYLAALPGSYTLLEYFSAHGYRTLGSGKVFHSFGSGKKVWDEYFSQRPQDEESATAAQDHLFEKQHFSWGPVETKILNVPDIQVARAAANWLKNPSDRPFFLAVGFHKPHLPWKVPQRFFDDIPAAQASLPEGFRNGDLRDVPRVARGLARREEHQRIVEADAWEDAVQAYLASVHFADIALGIVLRALRKGPHRQNTIVVVTSDHGFHLGEKSHWGKYTLWRQATRIPLILAVPGSPAAGKRTDRPATLVDLYPTLVELCGMPPARNLDGVSLAPLLEDPQRPWPHPAITTHRLGNTSVRTEEWALLRYHDGSQELYHTTEDPFEEVNLARGRDFQEPLDRLAGSLPATYAPNAPFVFKPFDLQDTARNLLRFFPPDELKDAIDRQAEERE